MSGRTIADFYPGLRCRITKVHHPAFQAEVGRHVIVVKVNPATGSVWTHDDVPAKTRINKRGREVTVYNPKGIQTPRSIDDLEPCMDQSAQESKSQMTHQSKRTVS